MNNIKFVGVQKHQKVLAEETIEEVLGLLSKKSDKLERLFKDTTITIGDNLIDLGAKANAEKMEIILDAQKNSLSLKDAENFLVSQSILNPGDWTKTFTQNTEQWSCLIYQLIHEFGHIVDGNVLGEKYHRISVDFSPTKYGNKDESEAFAEIFTYWVFGAKLGNNLSSIVENTISKISSNIVA